MLRDDVELLSGKVLEGGLTPALYLLLRTTNDMSRLCRDLGIEEEKADDNTPGTITQSGSNAAGGLSLAEWLSHFGEPVSL